MLSATRAHKPCPKCRRQFLSIFESTFAHVPLKTPALRFRAAPHPIARSRRIDSRCFSTTRPKFQEPESGSPVGTKPEAIPEVQPEVQPEPEPEVEVEVEVEAPPPIQAVDEAERVVRQARRAFGDTLPRDYLTEEEYKLYVRLYGPPLRETEPGDVAMPIPTEPIVQVEPDEDGYESSQSIVLRKMEDEQYEEGVYRAGEVASPNSVAGGGESDLAKLPEDVALQDLPSETGLTYIHAIAGNQREFDALLRLQKDFETAALRPPEEIKEPPAEEVHEEEDEDEERDEDEDDDPMFLRETSERSHEYSKLGYWRLNPSTVHLPKVDFVTPITQLLDRTSIKHVRETAEKAFGGAGLPFSVATPRTGRNAEQKPLGMASSNHKMSEIDADAFIATMLPGMYASSMTVLVEIRRRLGYDWISKLIARGNGDGPRVLDVGTGGAGLAAWEQVLRAEWDIIRDKDANQALDPPGRKTAVVGSETLRQRVSRFLHNTTFLPRLPDYLHSGDHHERLDGGDTAAPRKQFDIIIASHQLMPLKEGFRRKAMLENLWEMLSPEGGVLIVLEKGYPRGFEAVADARAYLLDEFIESPTSDPRPESIETENRREREPGFIIAPCTNHKACPMYLTPGLTHGRKDFCHFSQRFIRPPFLQRIVDADHRNHEDINFSFVAVQRGTYPGTTSVAPTLHGREATEHAFKGYLDSPHAPNPLSLPRNILPPIKSHGHITLDVCTPAATIERWIVPKSFGQKAYHDARKAHWGDLWALGAKTRTQRPVRLGKGGPAPNDGGVRARRAAAAGKARVFNLEGDSGGIYRAAERGKKKNDEPRRRTSGKKGRFAGQSTLMKDLGLEAKDFGLDEK